MEDKVFDVIIKGIEDERYAMNAFIKLCSATTSPKMHRRFLLYAMEEMEHLLALVKYSEDFFPDRPLRFREEPIPEITDMTAFLIEYLAKEESAIFYYDTLVNLVQTEEHRMLFAEIGKQEKEHLEHLSDLLKEYMHDLAEDGINE